MVKTQNTRPKRKYLYALAAVAALGGVLAREPLMERLFPPQQPEPTRPQLRVPAAPETDKTADVREIALQRADKALAWADAESQFALGQHVHALEVFFGDAKQRTPEFSRSMLGWSSKWRLVSDKMPFTRDDRHASFIRQTFARELFSPEQLRQATDQLARSYADSIAGVENVMLVRLRADLSDLPASALPAFVDDARLKATYEQAIKLVHEKASAELKVTLSRETTSVVVSEVLTLVAVRLGVSAGILTAGAGTSWATLGAGLAVGLIVDQVITFAWDNYRDPAGELSRKINLKLDEIRTLVLNGDGHQPGLKVRLVEMSKQRSEQRKLALRQMILESEPVAQVSNP